MVRFSRMQGAGCESESVRARAAARGRNRRRRTPAWTKKSYACYFDGRGAGYSVVPMLSASGADPLMVRMGQAGCTDRGTSEERVEKVG